MQSQRLLEGAEITAESQRTQRIAALRLYCSHVQSDSATRTDADGPLCGPPERAFRAAEGGVGILRRVSSATSAALR